MAEAEDDGAAVPIDEHRRLREGERPRLAEQRLGARQGWPKLREADDSVAMQMPEVIGGAGQGERQAADGVDEDVFGAMDKQDQRRKLQDVDDQRNDRQRDHALMRLEHPFDVAAQGEEAEPLPDQEPAHLRPTRLEEGNHQHQPVARDREQHAERQDQGGQSFRGRRILRHLALRDRLQAGVGNQIEIRQRRDVPVDLTDCDRSQYPPHEDADQDADDHADRARSGHRQKVEGGAPPVVRRAGRANRSRR